MRGLKIWGHKNQRKGSWILLFHGLGFWKWWGWWWWLFIWLLCTTLILRRKDAEQMKPIASHMFYTVIVDRQIWSGMISYVMVIFFINIARELSYEMCMRFLKLMRGTVIFFWSPAIPDVRTQSTVISVNMPTPHFYRKYAHPFSEGSFLKILW